MAPDDSLDRESLTSNTVAQLREICKKHGLMVSGKKSELVDRILEFDGVEAASTEDDPEEPLIMDEEPEGDTRDRVDEVLSKLSGEVVEAEVIEAELVFDEPEEPSETEEPIILGEDDQPSLVISMPTLSSLGDRWKATAAVLVVVLLVGAGATIFLKRSSGFTVAELQFGDSMEFQVTDSSVNIIGEEMLGLVRDSSGEILEDACDQLSIQISQGSGSVLVSDGPESGAKETTDSLGRSGFLTAEKRLTMNLDMDFEGKTWRDDDKTDCGNIMWLVPDNELTIDSTSWVELEKREVKRTDTSISFIDVDSVATNLRTVTYDGDGLGGLAALLPTLSFPLTPIELHDFFGDAVIKDGARSSDPDLNWNSDWNWEVKHELRDDSHGLVYKVEMEHEDIGRCYGHARITLLIKEGSPWPVSQQSSILLDKDEQTGSCDFLVSALSEEILPEGRVSITMSFSKSTSSSGSTAIDWGRSYLGSPTDGEDRPGTSTKRNWVDAMWDESEIRPFDLEEGLSCLKSSYPTNEATLALESGGYIWDAKWSKPTGEPEWNLSWVDEADDSGWLVLRKSPEGCEILSSGSNDGGSVKWNRDSIPDTQTMSLLEERILSPGKYPDLGDYIRSGDSWHLEAEVGYRLSVTEDNDLLTLLPGNLGDGKVTMTASRDWESGGRTYSLEMAMDAETGEMVLWYLIDRSGN